MVELEYKYMTNEEKANKLKRRFNFCNTVYQTNKYFIDYNNILRKNHITVRQRIINNDYFFQVKFPVKKTTAKDNPANLSVRNEFSEPCSPLMSLSEMKDKIFYLTGIYVPELFSPGNMETIRNVCVNNDNTKVLLDINSYLGMEDYEIEVEIKNAHTNDAIELLSELEYFIISNSSPGKCTRFMQRYHSMVK